MIINFAGNINTSFRSKYTDKYFDDPESIREDYQLIKEYEDLTDENNKETTFLNDMLRDDELFDRRRDYADSGYNRYDNDDLPLSKSITYRNINKDLVHKSQFIESGHSSSRGCSWNLIPIPQIYTAENGWGREHESFQERLKQGYKRSDISNIYHFSLVDTGVEGQKRMDFNLAKAGFKLLDRGKSIYQTADIMDKSKLHYGDGSTRFNQALCGFLADYPDSRRYVVETKGKSERLRPDIMKIYGELDEICPEWDDKERVIRACQTGHSGNKEIDEKLFTKCSAEIRAGVPVIKCTKAIKSAQLSKGKDFSEFSEDLYKFCLRNPDSRAAVVVTKNGYEYFDKDRAKVYTSIKRKCKNKSDVKNIINACTIGDYYDQHINKNLCELSIKLLEKEPEWTNQHSKIMASVIKQNRYNDKFIDESKFELAKTMVEGEYSVGSIYATVVLNHKNPELCK